MVNLNSTTENQSVGVEANKGTLFIVSTRPPKLPLSGGMAPAVREASVGYDQVMWFALGVAEKHSDLEKTPILAYKVDQFDVRQRILTEDHWSRHYDECCNRLIWPACHDQLEYAKNQLEQQDIEGYEQANYLLSKDIAEEMKKRNDTTSNVFVQDYHHFSLARHLRTAGIENPLTFFNHIPLPSKQTFDSLGIKEKHFFTDLMKSLLEYDSVQFQTEQILHCFLDMIGYKDLKPSVPAYNSIILHSPNGGLVRVGHAPISIYAQKVMQTAARSLDQSNDALYSVAEHRGTAVAAWLEDQLEAEHVFLNFERCDYTKGILERVGAFKKLMETHPELHGKVQLVLQAEPTRTDIPEYKKYAEDVKSLADTINQEASLKVNDKDPVIFINENIPNSKLLKIIRREKGITDGNGARHIQRRIGAITPIKDGMNLTAKEFAACQNTDHANPIILSRGAGAAAELDLNGQGAIVYTPVRDDPDRLANVMFRALAMSQEEVNRRAHLMREAVLSNTIHDWGEYFENEPARIAELNSINLERTGS